MATSSTSTYFEDLPIELRCPIMKSACFEQRNIDVSLRTLEIVATLGGPESVTAYAAGSLITYTKPPPVLHVNKEFRAEALKYYSLVDFSCPRYSGALKGSQFYINWKTDRLCFSSMIDLMARERGWYGPGLSLAANKVRKICLKNGLKNLGWNIADIESLRIVENYRLSAHQSTEVMRTLPWSHLIDEFVIFYNKGTDNSNSRGEIVKFGSAPLILSGNKTWLDGIHFNTARNNFQTGNVTQGAGAFFIDHLDDLDWRWWYDHELLGQETTMRAFEQGREARKAVNRVRLLYNVERVEPRQFEPSVIVQIPRLPPCLMGSEPPS
ncbi:uncharacterized protein EAF01_007609 [Botrytis porri]|uniref:2EXR domain-containing protein n=1 Tax=Botrytis porri TaxID=87229 RepID=A0A4Z1KTG1_9HELO|nr:uncharacterized protein EAF01_007609 [Botrytis porri]KAF7900307.1 hypothetical protein EAF01_007609 [Botrytis porri]TGO87499.1 hypothetical protein BPOR_0222g00140 [Botrytis porri]